MVSVGIIHTYKLNNKNTVLKFSSSFHVFGFWGVCVAQLIKLRLKLGFDLKIRKAKQPKQSVTGFYLDLNPK